MNEKTLPDTELLLLEALEHASREDSPVSQRDLAHRSGLSLGMVNILVRRFVNRGWVKLSRASPRTWAYALTPAGFEEVGVRTLSFLRKTAAAISSFHERIESFIISARSDGVRGILYEADPSLAFLVRYACQRHGLEFFDQFSLPQASPPFSSRNLVRLVASGSRIPDATMDSARSGIRTIELYSLFSPQG